MTQNGNVMIVSTDGEKEKMMKMNGKFSMMRTIHSLNHNGRGKKMSETTTDSRKKSLSEAFVNSFGSYPIGYGIGILVLPLSLGWLNEDPFMANIFITLTYAIVSFVRVYFLRRLFLKFGFDDNFLKLGIKLYQKIRNKINLMRI